MTERNWRIYSKHGAITYPMTKKGAEKRIKELRKRYPKSKLRIGRR